MPYRQSGGEPSVLAKGRLLRTYELARGPSTAFDVGGNNVIVTVVPEGQRMQLAKVGWRWWALYDFPVADISIRARARIEGQPKIGLTLRRTAIGDTQLGYVAYVKPSLRVVQIEIFAGSSYRPLTAWTEVASLRDDGSWNELEFRVGGDLMLLEINGAAVLTVRDATFGAGVAGMEVHGEPGDAVIVSEVQVHRVE